MRQFILYMFFFSFFLSGQAQKNESTYVNNQLGEDIINISLELIDELNKNLEFKFKCYIINVVNIDTLHNTYSFSLGYLYDYMDLKNSNPKNYFYSGEKVVVVTSKTYSSELIQQALGFEIFTDLERKKAESQIFMEGIVHSEFSYSYIVTKDADIKKVKRYNYDYAMSKAYQIFSYADSMNFIIETVDSTKIDNYYKNADK